jgi:hypothetical protein
MTQPDTWPALRDFEIVRTDLTQTAHSEIAINSVVDFGRPEDDCGFAAVPRPVLLSAAQWASGVLARIADAARAQIGAETDHDCPTELWGENVEKSCCVSTNLVAADCSFAAADADGPAYVSIEIPTTSAAAWQERVARWLEACA